MAWVKVPPENHPLFQAALPKDARVETMKMFGGVAAKVNGHIFAGLFGRSTMLLLPESMMRDPKALRSWIARAFKAAARLPPKAAQKRSPRKKR